MNMRAIISKLKKALIQRKGQKMIIETEPCKDCDFSPEYCSCEIDICQVTRGESRPVGSRRYEEEKLRRYEEMENARKFPGRWQQDGCRWGRW